VAKLKVGLREMSKRELLPEGEYKFLINDIRTTKDGSGEGAFLEVVKGPDPELVGRRSYMYLMNLQTEDTPGLSPLLASLQLIYPPDGEYGEGDTHNLIGLEFDAQVVISIDKKTGNDRNYVNPEYDADWLDEVRNASDEELERLAGKKKSRKKAARR